MVLCSQTVLEQHSTQLLEEIAEEGLKETISMDANVLDLSILASVRDQPRIINCSSTAIKVKLGEESKKQIE